jgi:hypothetical protein
MGWAGGGVTLILLFLTIFGLDHGGGLDGSLDVSVEAGADGHGDGSLFSTRSVAAFFLGFGGFGSIVYGRTHNALLAGGVGFIAGVILHYAIYFIGKRLMRLQSDGTVDYAQAVGGTGTIYITVPPKRESGGQAQIVFNNRHEVVNVISDTDAPLPAGTPVRVKAFLAGNLFLVEPL